MRCGSLVAPASVWASQPGILRSLALEGQPSAVRAAATFLWRSGVPRSALYVVRLKIRPFQNPVGISGSMVFGDPGDV